MHTATAVPHWKKVVPSTSRSGETLEEDLDWYKIPRIPS